MQSRGSAGDSVINACLVVTQKFSNYFSFVKRHFQSADKAPLVSQCAHTQQQKN